MKGSLQSLACRARPLRPLLVLSRKVRLILFSYQHLPQAVSTPLSGAGGAVTFETRNWQTAMFCRGNMRDGVLDYEPNQHALFSVIASKSAVVFDVGAQIGYYAIIAAKLGARKVVAFEIEPAYARIAEKHARGNGVSDRVEVVCAAVGDGMSRATQENIGMVSSDDTRALDAYCARTGVWPDFLKIDIEGYEAEAFEGARGVLSRRPVVMLALHPELVARRGRSTRDVFRLLLRAGYAVISLGPHDVGVQVSDPADTRFITGEANDFLCIPAGDSRAGTFIVEIRSLAK